MKLSASTIVLLLAAIGVDAKHAGPDPIDVDVDSLSGISPHTGADKPFITWTIRGHGHEYAAPTPLIDARSHYKGNGDFKPFTTICYDQHNERMKCTGKFKHHTTITVNAHRHEVAAATPLIDARHHHKDKSTSTKTATKTTAPSSASETTMKKTTTTSKSSPTPTNIDVPGCNSTVAWTEGMPTVCQLRAMIRKANQQFNNTIFLQSPYNSNQYEAADSFADTLTPRGLISSELVEGTGETAVFIHYNDQGKNANVTEMMLTRRRMSQALAMECSGNAYILTPEDVGIAEAGYMEHTSESWFALYDYPALMRNPKVKQVINVWEMEKSWDAASDSPFATKVIWKRGDKVTFPLYDADLFQLQTQG